MNKIKEYVKHKLLNREGGHDYWHALRVYNNAQLILKSTEANTKVVLTASLIHDVIDDKFEKNNATVINNEILELLESDGFSISEIEHVFYIINHMSFKGGLSQADKETIEFKIVQDADRLDAIGAIGIARTFNYGGFKDREMYNPNIPPQVYKTSEEYRNSTAPTINHFYEKLLKLKDSIHTEEAKLIAEKRHLFMLTFLEQFYSEWGETAERFYITE